MTPDPLSCAEVDRELADLALGQTGEPRRSALLEHAAGCLACGERLGELVTITDHLLELAPDAEPPTGFESRAVAAMSSPTDRRRLPRPAVAGAAAALVAAVLVVWAIAVGGPSGEPEVTAAPILGRTGAVLGTAELDRGAGRLRVTMEGPAEWTGRWSCEVRAGGRWVEVGSWSADEVTDGGWATGLPDSAPEPRAMRILGSAGTVIATADLTDDP